ncbi:MAG: dihydrolipoyllysine-residue acetyltransferase [Polaromonas sp.]|nr:dihydrolipoyllysine-residue acetyltransferase [Polaromonas sp.]
MAAVEIQVPDIGDFDEVTVIELLVKPGDTVKADQSLITVESDKASMEIPSSQGGVIKAVLVKLGDKVKQGSVVLTLESDTAAPAAAPASEKKPAETPVNRAQAAPEIIATATATAPAVAKPASGGATAIEVRVPDIGDFKDVSVIEVLVKPGDAIKAEQSLITVESDKASMEIPSSAAGVLKELKVKLGDVVNIGDLLAVLEGVATSPSPQASPASGRGSESPAAPTSSSPSGGPGESPVAPTPSTPSTPSAAFAGEGQGEGGRTPPTAALPAHEPTSPTGQLPHASPSVRKFARELGVPLAEVQGQGPKGRITQDDVQAFTRSVMSGATSTQAQAAKAPPAAAAASPSGAGLNLLPWPKIDFTKFGPVERKDLSRIKKISGANLHRNWVMIPHVTNHDNADVTELEAFRVQLNKENEKAGIKLTMLAFAIKACVAALKKFPDFNTSLDGDQLVYKQYFHIGFAADTPNGLMVPVLKDADKKGVMQISSEMAELSKKAREGKLGPADMSGACFSISSLGGIGGRYFHPIINAPEVAILGLSKSLMEPVWNGSEFKPRLMLPMSLSYDHRVIDGASAARFNVYLGQILADFRRVLL